MYLDPALTEICELAGIDALVELDAGSRSAELGPEDDPDAAGTWPTSRSLDVRVATRLAE